ncbi:hypothetical protein ACR780_10075 [Sphingobacterium faecium]|uniref:hypothetical protein n=1 Tax=Sphingobacterium faecium TaxID=34087 RepID=UPI003DA35B9E
MEKKWIFQYSKSNKYEAFAFPYNYAINIQKHQLNLSFYLTINQFSCTNNTAFKIEFTA